ncbi:hypothetical protein ACN47E_000797 [Coniothyrium glycines]
MSRKGNDDPSAVRIRDNQRRSRARRKELIDDLQKQVREYERKGVVATQEVQASARHVALENMRLRSLLAQIGISEQQIAAYLRSAGDGDSDAPALYARLSMAGQSPSAIEKPNSIGPQSLALAGPSSGNSPCSGPEIPANHNGSHQDAVDHQAHSAMATKPVELNLEPKSQACCTSPVSENPHKAQILDSNNGARTNNTEAEECPTTATCFCPPTAVLEPRSQSSGLEISCDAAATIIAGMRADADREAIRTSLGCVGDEQCRVKNSAVLQLMDES